jgi:hypothetical protein
MIITPTNRADVQRPNVTPLRAGLVGLMLFACGCGTRDIERTYGRRRGGEGAGSSINGTDVLANMFREDGLRVSTWTRLSPRLDTADVIIWFPDDFQPPTDEQRMNLEQWLRRGTGRTLVYVGRDYDSAPGYWRRVQPEAPPGQAMEIARRLAMAESDHDTSRLRMPTEEDCGWFVAKRESPHLDVRELDGPWSAGIDPANVEIETDGRLDPPSGRRFHTMLAAADVPLVFEVRDAAWGTGKVLVVVNGSFLLNLPLVNHEHRKLAGRLIASCAPAKRVIMLESGAGGPDIVERDAESNFPTGLEIFTVWPLGFIMLHLAIAGITLCIACFPIFGRPIEPMTASHSDFGEHVTALGELLARTRDREYAVDRLKYYHEQVRTKSSEAR